MAGRLTQRQVAFAQEFLVDLNGTQAVIRAGYTRRGAEVTANRLLRNPNIQRAIQDAQDARAKRNAITVDRVLRELGIIGFADMATYLKFQEDGSVVLDWSNLPPEATRAISEVTVDEYTDGTGENARPVKRMRFKLYDKQRALEMIAKHLGMFMESSSSVHNTFIDARSFNISDEEARDIASHILEG